MQPIHAFMIIAILVFMIPVLAVIGGIIGGILKAQGRQRLAELIQRERIAALEKGIDPSKLPPLPVLDRDLKSIVALMPTDAQRARGFLITGVVLLGASIGLIVMLLLLTDARHNQAWAAGLLPLSIAIALLVSARIVRRSAGGDQNGGPKA